MYIIDIIYDMVKSMIKAILIDIDNTLLDFFKSSEKAIKILFEQKGVVYSEKVYTTFTEINEALWLQIEKKEITKPEMYKLRWKLILEKLNIDYDSDIMETDFRAILSGIAEPVKNAYEILEYLSKDYKLYAASNSSFEHQRKRLTQSDMLKFFNDLFVSEKVGALKPAKEFFDVCFSHLGNVTKDEVVMIGDSLSADILGGFNYGIKTIWFNPNSLENTSKATPDYIVNDLLEIKNVL